MSPADRLHRARHALGFSVEQMADALALRGANAGDDIRKWERGAREPSGVVVRCAEALAHIRALLDVMLESVNDQRPIAVRARDFLYMAADED